jgi:Flp pilus assembly secretin CpaC
MMSYEEFHMLGDLHPRRFRVNNPFDGMDSYIKPFFPNSTVSVTTDPRTLITHLHVSVEVHSTVAISDEVAVDIDIDLYKETIAANLISELANALADELKVAYDHLVPAKPVNWPYKT